MATPQKRVFLIDGATAERFPGNVRNLGFKAYNLARMARLGLPVPQAVVFSPGYAPTFASNSGREGRTLLQTHVRWLEQASGLTYGGSRRPLLLSVRSSAAVSMPGMMETVLNVGLTTATLRGFLRMTGNPKLIWDSYRRLIQSFAKAVHGVEPRVFQACLQRRLQKDGLHGPAELDSRSLETLTQEYLAAYAKATGTEFPQDPMLQLELAVQAVYGSWSSVRALEYRRLHRIDESLGTAVTVQRMVFGNAGGLSGSGVAFSRDPASGTRSLYMDFTFDSQGEDIVSGHQSLHDQVELALVMPAIHAQIQETSGRLEAEFRDVQEFEFTVQEGVLYLLQTGSAKRTPLAALRIAADHVREGLISPVEALQRIEGIDLGEIEEVRLRPGPETPLLGTAVPAGVGVSIGAIALDTEKVAALKREGRRALLVREGASTEDIAGIAQADGLLTARGGRTSHAAVVARQLEKVCLVGCASLSIDLLGRACSIGGSTLREGDTICIDANNGSIFAGEPRYVTERPTALIEEARDWSTSAAAAIRSTV
jgi:pyruvate, orthophosphate dikinase